MRDKARNALLTAQANIKAQYDAHKRQDEFKVGDKVYLSTKRYSDFGYIIQHMDQLRHLDTDKYTSRIPTPEPEVIMDDGTIEYEVESILKHRVRKYGKGSLLEYLIHWKGYASHDDTWEPLSNLSNCMELLHEYHATLNIPQPIPIHAIYVVSIGT
eukprot:4526269-Pyramimonas_sp.AAC.1